MQLHIRVTIDLQNPNLIILVNHKIHAHELEPHFPPIGINFPIRGPDRVPSYPNHLRNYFIPKNPSSVLVPRLTVDISLLICPAQFQSQLISLHLITVTVLLYGIVGLMDKFVIDIF